MEVTGLTHRVRVRERGHGAEVRQEAMQAASRARLGELATSRVGIVAAEMVSNLLKHTSDGGEVLINALAPTQGPGAVELIAIDRGPGMANAGLALADGYSTGGSAGTGLGAIRRQANTFDMHSAPRLGTAVLARFVEDGVRPDPPGFAVGGVSVAKDGEEVSGDGWAIARRPAGLQLLVVDGLGHGMLASEAALAAVQTFRKQQSATGVDALQAAHEALRRTRGATAAVASIDLERQELRYTGVGNIAARLLDGDANHALVSMNGTLGRDPVRWREFQSAWADGCLLVMHSDGLSSHWELASPPGLVHRDPALVAAVLFRDHARQLDDVTVVVVRQATHGRGQTE